MKRTIFLCLFVICILLCTGCSSLHAVPTVEWTEISPKELIELEDFNYSELEELNGNQIEFSYDLQTNQLKKINGCYTTVIIANKEDALQSLSNVRSLFNITDFSFYCSLFEKRDTCKVIELQQLYKDILVDNGYFRIVTDTEGRALSIEGHYVSNVHLDIHEKLTASECIDKVDLKWNRINDIQLCIIEQNSVFLLCWKISTEQEIYYLDADTGEVLKTITTMFD